MWPAATPVQHLKPGKPYEQSHTSVRSGQHNPPSSRRMVGVRGMRSLEARVSILLSSITVFMDSIHSASMSPSSTIHCKEGGRGRVRVYV